MREMEVCQSMLRLNVIVSRRSPCRYLTTKTTVKAKMGHKATLTKNQEISVWLKLNILFRRKHSNCRFIGTEMKIGFCTIFQKGLLIAIG